MSVTDRGALARAALAAALRHAGVDAADPEVRAAIIAEISGRPRDRKLTTAERRAYALELRRGGATYRQIADLVGFAGPGPAYKSVMAGLAAIPREPAEAVRQIAIDRLEAILAGNLYRNAVKGDVAAIDRVIAVMRETRRYIPGVEVPVNAELTGAGGGAIIVELNIPDPVPVEPVPQGELSAGVIDLAPDDYEEVAPDGP